MFFHPSVILFFFSLIFSVVMMISVNSWFMVWFFIEKNLLFFIPLVLVKKSKYSVESSLKYFFIQTLSSIFILLGFLLLFMNLSIFTIFLVSGLSVKLGLAPFHQWVVNIVEGLSWPLIWILFTIQKFGPFLLFNYMYMIKEDIIYIVYFIILMCAIVGSLGGLFTSSLRKIMAFSSISHSSWLILGLFVSVYLWTIYFIFYSVVLFSVLYIFSDFYLSSLNHLFLKLSLFLSLSMGVGLLSMGGMPPFTGFAPKFIVMKEIMFSCNFFVLLILLMSVFVSLFFYARVFIINFIFLSVKSLFVWNKSDKVSMSLFINMMGLFLIPFIMYLY
uniref:NADH-ubiquinone oxidoreductase chain 2 n=1 Tax=Longipodacrangonyx sp. 1 MDMBR-2012 TaxID=1200665 RepID=K7ZVQ5_9CRUS|nr:NADH dehydrogenase subunit 2 [Longipodacrangonyx sp. 1 MDMBR-2012]